MKDNGLLRLFAIELWSEKYRPRRLDEIVGQDEIVEKLKAVVKRYRNTGVLSTTHMLFYGPPGTGKTATAYAFAREILNDSFEYCFKEINASDERKLENIRDVVKNFVRYTPLMGNCKILLLDECDNLTQDSFKALRRIMETYSGNCLFVLTANEIKSIPDAIISRCARYEFRKIPFYVIEKKLKEIVEREGVSVDESKLTSIAISAEGDLRWAINELQRVLI